MLLSAHVISRQAHVALNMKLEITFWARGMLRPVVLHSILNGNKTSINANVSSAP
jgi:hypothetical protein